MHRVKSKARKSAWYNRLDEGTNYNPFGKPLARGPSNAGDLEAQDMNSRAGLQRGITSNSESIVENFSRENRRSQYDDHSGPSHAMTMPPDSAGSETRMPFSTVNGASAKGKGNSEESNATTSDTLTNGETANKPRRRLGGILGMKSSEKEENEVERTETGRSKHGKKKFTFMGQIKALFGSPINVLLVAAPVGIGLHFANVNPIAIFVVNFIAIIPLAALLSYCTEEIALRTGETIGGLLNATFGNAVELIVSVIALVQNEILIVQTSLIGSILSNLLLVMGMCFFFGGWSRTEQHFNVIVAQTASSLLSLAIASLVIPTAFFNWAANVETSSSTSASQEASIEASIKFKNEELSRGVSILLLLVYGCYLFFQLKTHAEIYNMPSEKTPKNKKSGTEKGEAISGMAKAGANLSASAGGSSAQSSPLKNSEDDEEEAEEPQLSLTFALLGLAGITVFVALCAEFLVDSIDAVVATSGISKNFVGLILLPIVGNAAEHATAVTVACKDKMDLAIGVAVGSSMQIALFVLPFIVTLGWIMGKGDMDLSLDPFQVIVLFVSVLLVNYLIGDGKSHWLEGVLLMTLYLIISIAAWFYPQETNTAST